MTSRLTVAADLLLEATTKEVVTVLDARSVPHILLKGPLLRRRLFPDGDSHVSADIDVLVPPDRWEDGRAALSRIGFEPLLLDIIPGDRPNHARPHVRGFGPSVDLHHTLHGATAAPEVVWPALQAEAEAALLGDVEVTVLALPAQLLHVALHAAQNGRENERTTRYLARCLEVADPATSIRALRLATEIGATDAFALGLSLAPAGRELSRELGIAPRPTVTMALRATSAPNTAHALEWLATRASFRERARFVLHKAFPPRAYMASSYPGVRTRTGLVLSYPARWLWLARELPSSLRVLRQARAASNGSQPVEKG